MSVIQEIDAKIKQKRQERLYQEDYTRTMEKEYKRLEEERIAEEKEYEEYQLAYDRDSAKFGF